LQRVEEYISSGQDKNIVDPDPNKVHFKRKQSQSQLQAVVVSKPATSVKYPNDGWSTSLEIMPSFSRAEMNLHITKTGKQIDPSVSHHSVPTGLRKAKTFLEDEYLKDIQTASDANFFYFKCQCHHSFRKNDPPHNLKVALDLVTAEVIHANCSCVAGQVGFCNHILALMMQICKFTLYESKNTKDLNGEQDMTPKLACTSSRQMWHKVGRSENIHPQPVMDLLVKKTKLNDSTTSTTPSKKPDGLRCLIYEARNNIDTQKADEIQLKADLMKINPNMALAQILSPTDVSEYVDTKFGRSPKGSYASYQLTFTESNFSVFCDIDSVPRIAISSNADGRQYPHFPLQNSQDFDIPENVTEQEKEFLQYISVDENKLNNIERKTQNQSHSEMWKNERMFRLTASNFDRVCVRQKQHENLAESLLYPSSSASRSRHCQHGQTYEAIALRQYEKYMFSTRRPVKVFKSGLVVSLEAPFIGASPDGKVIDIGCEKPYGLVEVKCPETKFRVTPLDACSDKGFYLENVNGKPKLKKTNRYYYQVQGQMGVTKAEWCDFVVYTSVGMSIERIKFDRQFWNTMTCKLERFYFDHYMKKASVKYHNARND